MVNGFFSEGLLDLKAFFFGWCCSSVASEFFFVVVALELRPGPFDFQWLFELTKGRCFKKLSSAEGLGRMNQPSETWGVSSCFFVDFWVARFEQFFCGIKDSGRAS